MRVDGMCYLMLVVTFTLVADEMEEKFEVRDGL